MPVITVHLSPLSYKILHTRYQAQGEEPYHIDFQDPYNGYFCHNPLKNDKKRTKAEYNLLTESIDFEVGKNIFRHLTQHHRNVRLGLFLHRIHKQKINEFIEAGQFYGDERWNALKKFCDMNGITEDDYALGSAYKSWQRYQIWKENNTKKLFLSKTHAGIRKGTKYRFANGRKPIPYQSVIIAVNNYFDCGLVNLLNRPVVIKRNNKKFYYAYDKQVARKHVYERSLLFYLLSRWSLFSTTEIWKLTENLSLRWVRSNISTIKSERKIYDHVNDDIEKIKKLL